MSRVAKIVFAHDPESGLTGACNEAEILFPRETQFRIESVTPTADGEATLIVLTEL